MKRIILIRAFVLALAFGTLVLTAAAQQSAPPKDGELQLPADYKSWSKFLFAVQRQNAKQVLDLYVNPKGAKAS